MTPEEWMRCDEPDLMLEELLGRVHRAQLIEFVRNCWERVARYLPDVPHEITAAQQFAALAETLNDRDAIIYASEAALKAAGLTPNLRAEQKRQAELLRQIAGHAT